jgi:hypothetical protein
MSRANGDGQDTSYSTQRPDERQLSRKQEILACRYTAHGSEDSHGHRQIESRTFFADVGGSQIDRYGFVGISEPGVDQRALDSLPAFANGSVGHTHGHEVPRGPAGVHIHFDVDQVGIDTEYGRTSSAKKGHVPIGGGEGIFPLEKSLQNGRLFAAYALE